MNETEIKKLLERLGKSLSAGNAQVAAECYAFPALFLSDDGATVLADAEQLAGLFAQATEWYQSRAIVSTKPELERVEMLSEKLVVVDVRWPGFDASGREKHSERSHYVLQFQGDGRLCIRVALTRTS